MLSERLDRLDPVEQIDRHCVIFGFVPGNSQRFQKRDALRIVLQRIFEKGDGRCDIPGPAEGFRRCLCETLQGTLRMILFA
jgi:hypothetical protein